MDVANTDLVYVSIWLRLVLKALLRLSRVFPANRRIAGRHEAESPARLKDAKGTKFKRELRSGESWTDTGSQSLTLAATWRGMPCAVHKGNCTHLCAVCQNRPLYVYQARLAQVVSVQAQASCSQVAKKQLVIIRYVITSSDGLQLLAMASTPT